MPLPGLNANGDLPPGVHRATLQDVVERFGGLVGARARCTRNLMHIYELVERTGHLHRFVVFGSYVTNKEEPNDIDVILVMNDDFHPAEAAVEIRGLFDHAVAQARYGASVFWIQPSILIGETLDEFISYWQVKQDETGRGIVEIVP